MDGGQASAPTTNNAQRMDGKSFEDVLEYSVKRWTIVEIRRRIELPVLVVCLTRVLLNQQRSMQEVQIGLGTRE